MRWIFQRVMSKFGEIITSEVPVLLTFSTFNDAIVNEVTTAFLKEIANVFQSQVKVLHLDIEQNQTLTKALNINYIPSFLIYKNGQLKWRHNGEIAVKEIVEVLSQF